MKIMGFLVLYVIMVQLHYLGGQILGFKTSS